jgi:glycosyltransferase involved in cell wall biosynthesis
MLDVWSLKRSRWKKRIAMALVHGRMLRGAGAIHALNAHERNTIAALRLGPPIEVIPNGVFLEEIEIPSDIAAFRASVPGLGDRPYALFLSRLHFKKGLDILAEAWKLVGPEFPDHRLVVAGPREDDSIDDFRRRIAAAGVQGSVVEAGAVYAGMKVAAFRGCACFVLPSRQEGFSVAITEALALGAPVVVSRDCHFPEVSEVGAGIETSLDPTEFAAAMRRMLGDAGLRASAGGAGARLVRERFVWPQIAAQTIRLYERIARS